MDFHSVSIGNICFGNHLPFVLIAGPDSLESREHAFMMARAIKDICQRLGIGYVFKASYDKANRTSASGFRGIGMEEGVKILAEIREELGIPVTTDIHNAHDAKLIGGAIDLIQIPALLSRQTDLITAAAETGMAVNIKKGQFIAPHDAGHMLKKALATKNDRVLITERGFSFGYNNVVVDMRGLEVMKRSTRHPIIFDASHTVQYPSAGTGVSGGDRTLIPPLARAAVAVGIAGIFMEVHQDPDNAPVDGPNSLHLEHLEDVLKTLQAIDRVVKAL